MFIFKSFLTICFTLILLCCKQTEDVRKPISKSSGSFMKKSIERNKKLIDSEEKQIQSLIKNSKNLKYIGTKKGFWYTYLTVNVTDTLCPKKGDIAYFEYEITDLNGNIIYTKQQLKPQTYFIDKQNIMTGIREGIKLMHKKEKVKFLFPSHIAFGYHGDNNKIGINQPIICTITLNDFKPEININKPIKNPNQSLKNNILDSTIINTFKNFTNKNNIK